MKIGIRAENKNRFERRTPLVPGDIKDLISQGLEIQVQTSSQRALSDEIFRQAEIPVVQAMDDCQLILGIKEVPVDDLKAETVYLFFSHVIKGQAYNMPMLEKMMTLGNTLIDYERVTDAENRRLIFFGRHAGLAGMINSLWALGQRLLAQGIETPLQHLKQAKDYTDLKEAKAAITAAGEAISQEGLHPAVNPLVIGVSGYGNVAQGALEITELLPIRTISPDELKYLSSCKDLSNNCLYQVQFKEADCVEPLDLVAPFSLEEYYEQGSEKYRSYFEDYLPHLTLLVNCNYWDARYPKLVTKETLKILWQTDTLPKLKVIGDISCDIEGAIECTVKPTYPDNPVYLFNPEDGSVVDGFEGSGPVVMAVEILPTELPHEASNYFSRILKPYIPLLAQADFNGSFDELVLPDEIKRAVILHKGELTPDYEYLHKFLVSK